MFRKLMIAALTTLTAGCAHIGDVSLHGGAGHEERPDGRRDSVQAGAAIRFGQIKVRARYRYRWEGGQIQNPEHGFFLGASVPIYCGKK